MQEILDNKKSLINSKDFTYKKTLKTSGTAFADDIQTALYKNELIILKCFDIMKTDQEWENSQSIKLI